METIKLELDDTQKGAFNLYAGEIKTGKMVVSIHDTELTVYHTEVDPEASGKGYAKLLLDEMVRYTREHGYKVIPLCPYVFAQFKRHPDEYNDIWKKTAL